MKSILRKKGNNTRRKQVFLLPKTKSKGLKKYIRNKCMSTETPRLASKTVVVMLTERNPKNITVNYKIINFHKVLYVY
jgi:hypothetical protein